MQVFVIHEFRRPYLGGNLNMKQLLNPIFFERSVKHPDSKRQRVNRLRSLRLWEARHLKTVLQAGNNSAHLDLFIRV